MIPKQAVHHLNAGIVVDRSVLITLPTEELSQAIAGIRAAGAKSLCVVDGAEQFFTPTSLLHLMSTQNKRYAMVNEALGGFFTENQIELLMNAHAKVIAPVAVIEDGELIVNMGAVAEAPKAVVGGYTFVEPPAGWSISGNMSLGPTRIKRKTKNADGDGTLFWMSPTDLEKLWILASNAWAGIEGAPLQAKFNTGQGALKATIQDDRIALGGNYIRRYEIEQIAKYRNWAVPQLQAA